MFSCTTLVFPFLTALCMWVGGGNQPAAPHTQGFPPGHPKIPHLSLQTGSSLLLFTIGNTCDNL